MEYRMLSDRSSLLVLSWVDLSSPRTNPREGAAAPPTGPFPTPSPALSSLVRKRFYSRIKLGLNPLPFCSAGA